MHGDMQLSGAVDEKSFHEDNWVVIPDYHVAGSLYEVYSRQDVNKEDLVIGHYNICASYPSDLSSSLGRIASNLWEIATGFGQGVDIDYLNVLHASHCLQMYAKTIQYGAKDNIFKSLHNNKGLNEQLVSDSVNSAKHAVSEMGKNIAETVLIQDIGDITPETSYLLSHIITGFDETVEFDEDKEAQCLLKELSKLNKDEQISYLEKNLHRHTKHRKSDLATIRSEAVIELLQRITELHRAGKALISLNEVTIDQYRKLYDAFNERFNFVAYAVTKVKPDNSLIEFAEYYDKPDEKENKGPEGLWFAPVLMIAKSRFDILETGFKWISETPDIPSAGENAKEVDRNGILYALVHDSISETEFYFVSTHFSPAMANLAFSARFFNETVSRLEKTFPVIACGDFNTFFEKEVQCYNILQQQTLDLAVLTNNLGRIYQNTDRQDTWEKFPSDKFTPPPGNISRLDQIRMSKNFPAGVKYYMIDDGATDEYRKLLPLRSDNMNEIHDAIQKGNRASDHKALIVVLEKQGKQ